MTICACGCGRQPLTSAAFVKGHGRKRENRQFIDPVAFVWSKVDKSGECWIWTGGGNDHGYGRASVGGAQVYVHRYVYSLTNGAIPDGMHVLHHCDNPPCVRPEHLFLGTQADNAADMVAKGRHRVPPPERRGLNAKLTPEAVLEIRWRAEAGERRLTLAREFGVSKSNVQRIVLRKSWARLAAGPLLARLGRVP